MFLPHEHKMAGSLQSMLAACLVLALFAGADAGTRPALMCAGTLCGCRLQPHCVRAVRGSWATATISLNGGAEALPARPRRMAPSGYMAPLQRRARIFINKQHAGLFIHLKTDDPALEAPRDTRLLGTRGASDPESLGVRTPRSLSCECRGAGPEVLLGPPVRRTP